MSVKPFLALAVAASFATPAFSQTVDRCAANAVFSLTSAECAQYNGQVNAANQCVLTDSALTQARDELCLALPNGTGGTGGVSGIAAGVGIAALLAAVGGGDSTTTTTTTGTN